MPINNRTLLSAAQRSVLTAALNRIIPAEGVFPGAGDLGVAAAIEATLVASPRLRRAFLDGLAEISLTAWREHDRGFPELPADQQDGILKLVEEAQPAFFDRLVSHTYRAYYVQPAILRLVGAEPGPPQPRGYTLPPFDPARLENVRRRGQIFRRV